MRRQAQSAYAYGRRTESKTWIPFPCDSELGVPHYFVVGNEAKIVSGSQVRLRERVALDFLILGVFIECIDGTGARTDDFGVNFRDTLSEDWWILTGGSQGQGNVIPGVMVSGGVGLPLIWPAPRVVRENNSVEVLVTAGATDIRYVRIVFVGRRLRGEEAERLLCMDPRGSGYGALYFTPLKVGYSGEDGTPGSEVRTSVQVDARPYDFLMSRTTVIISEVGSFRPLRGAVGEIGIRQPTFRHEHYTDLVPTTYFGGMIATDSIGFAEGLVRPPSTPDGACWRLHQQSTIELIGRFVRRPLSSTNSEFEIHVVLHGQRIEPEGLPHYLFEGRAGEIANPCPPVRNDPARIDRAAWAGRPGFVYGRR